MTSPVLILATLMTKSAEVAFLEGKLAEFGVCSAVHDLDLGTAGRHLDGEAKRDAMARCAHKAKTAIADHRAAGGCVVVGLGGGTGTQIVLDALEDADPGLACVLITTFADDLRRDVADKPIIVIPTVSDLLGLNPTLRLVLTRAAGAVAGLVPVESQALSDIGATVGITALGVTSAGAEYVSNRLRKNGLETTVFHANGFGGKGFCRWLRAGRFSGVIDFTIHEDNWLRFSRQSAVPASRFALASQLGLPQVVVPGAINVRTRGPAEQLDDEDKSRPHYSHSPRFTHVALTNAEMAEAGMRIGRQLENAAAVVPMGGFSSEDRPGGAVENAAGRHAFLDALTQAAPASVEIIVLDAHINDPTCADAVVEAFGQRMDEPITSSQPSNEDPDAPRPQ